MIYYYDYYCWADFVETITMANYRQVIKRKQVDIAIGHMIVDILYWSYDNEEENQLRWLRSMLHWTYSPKVEQKAWGVKLTLRKIFNWILVEVEMMPTPKLTVSIAIKGWLGFVTNSIEEEYFLVIDLGSWSHHCHKWHLENISELAGLVQNDDRSDCKQLQWRLRQKLSRYAWCSMRTSKSWG